MHRHTYAYTDNKGTPDMKHCEGPDDLSMTSGGPLLWRLKPVDLREQMKTKRVVIIFGWGAGRGLGASWPAFRPPVLRPLQILKLNFPRFFWGHLALRGNNCSNNSLLLCVILYPFQSPFVHSFPFDTPCEIGWYSYLCFRDKEMEAQRRCLAGLSPVGGWAVERGLEPRTCDFLPFRIFSPSPSDVCWFWRQLPLACMSLCCPDDFWGMCVSILRGCWKQRLVKRCLKYFISSPSNLLQVGFGDIDGW